MVANASLYEYDDLLIEDLTPGLQAALAADLCTATFCRADSAYSTAVATARPVLV
ncbi:hypothetical protein ACFW1A_32855 [Kitasatospora sp. NPDC058965]|uniref:hypothetical protein n=1 Tax=Kitasatospora sp. NPDC058965 TaxID=3346682 RepID=UPI0036AB946C